MIFDDRWTEGLSKRQQNLIVEYILNECKLSDFVCEQAGYKKRNSAKQFLNSQKGRIAQRLYIDLIIDKDRDTARLKLIKQNIQRAFYNPADIINKDGKLVVKDLRDLGPLVYCIEGIKTKIVGVTPRGEEMKEIEVKLCDRTKAMAFLEKVFNIHDKEEIEDITGEKPIWEMSDEEREAKFIELVKKGGDETLRLLEEATGIKLIEEKEKDDL